MDNADREKAFARCSQRWAAATNFRRYRTAQQDKDAKRRRRALMAGLAALNITAMAVCIAGALAAALFAAAHANPDLSDHARTGWIALFAVLGLAATDSLIGRALEPLADRLNAALGHTSETEAEQ